MANLEDNDIYGARYNNGVDKVNAKANARMQQMIADVNSLPVNERLQYLRDNEREFKTLLKNDYSDLYKSSMKGGYASQIEQVAKDAKQSGTKYLLGASATKIFKDIAKSQSLAFGNYTQESANVLFDSVMRWVTDSGKSKVQPLIFDFSTLSTTKQGARLIASFQNDFYSSATLVNGNLAGVKRYRYAGATPERPFCATLLSSGNPSKPYHIEDIRLMDNGQTSNVFLTRGGYNCRHRWVAVAPTKADDKEYTPDPKNIDGLIINPSGKEKVWIKKGDDYQGYIFRKVENNGYKRQSGKTQKVKSDNDGLLYINAFGKGGAVA